MENLVEMFDGTFMSEKNYETLWKESHRIERKYEALELRIKEIILNSDEDRMLSWQPVKNYLQKRLRREKNLSSAYYWSKAITK